MGYASFICLSLASRAVFQMAEALRIRSSFSCPSAFEADNRILNSDEIQRGIARLHAEGLPARHIELLAPGIALRPLGDRDQRHVDGTELGL